MEERSGVGSAMNQGREGKKKGKKKRNGNGGTEQSNRLRSGHQVSQRSGLLWYSPNTRGTLKPVE